MFVTVLPDKVRTFGRVIKIRKSKKPTKTCVHTPRRPSVILFITLVLPSSSYTRDSKYFFLRIKSDYFMDSLLAHTK